MEEDGGGGGFRPPLYSQRLRAVATFLASHDVSSLLDFGCGEGSLLSYLRTEPLIRRMAGIDVDEAALQRAAKRTEPTLYELVVKRPRPLTISLHRGSICSPVHTRQVLRATHVAAQEVSSSEAGGEQVEAEDWDAISLVEVIEHLEPHDLPAMEANVFGRCRPRYVVVTTPNYEFNVVFNDPLGADIRSKRARPDTTYATSSSSSSTPPPTATTAMSSLPFRHDDHKFEWTRAEFEEWCNAVASRYGYSYTLSGVGTRQGWKRDKDYAEGEVDEEEEEEESVIDRRASSSKRKCPTSPGVEAHRDHDDSEVFGDVGFCTQIAYFARLDDDRTTPHEEAEPTATATDEPLQLYAVHSFPVDTRSDTEKLAATLASTYGIIVGRSEGELDYGDWVSVADQLLPLLPVGESCEETASPDRLRAALRAITAEPSRYFGLEYDDATDRVRIAAHDSDGDEEEPADDGGPLYLENEHENENESDSWRRANQAAERPSPTWTAGEEDGAWGGQSWGDSWDHE